MVDRTLFRNGMSRLAAAVTIIATDGEAGRHGFTASAVCSVSDIPPSLIVCMNRRVRSNAHFKDNGVLSVNVLCGQHQILSDIFAGSAKTADERFAEAAWITLATGAPILTDAAAAFDCVVRQVTEVGSHTVFMCSVIDMMVGTSSEGLVYFGRAYHTLRDEVCAIH